MGKFLTYIGNAAARLLTHADLAGLGAETHQLEQLGENKAIAFVRGVAQHVEVDLARFIAGHPALQADFHELSDEEAAEEQAARTGNAGGTSTSGSSTSSDDGSPSPTSGSSSTPGQ